MLQDQEKGNNTEIQRYATEKQRIRYDYTKSDRETEMKRYCDRETKIDIEKEMQRYRDGVSQIKIHRDTEIDLDR